MITLTPHQNKVIKAIRQHDFVKEGSFYLGGAAGTGKQLHEDSLIQTPFGPKAIKNIKVGQKVFTQDGSITHVTGVFPQGTKPAYKLTFRDKSEVIAGPEHQWAVITSRGNLKVVTTEDMLKKGVKSPCGVYRFQIPLCKPVDYPYKEFYIDPYLLGVLIGDGALTGSSTTISWGAQDRFILDKCWPMVHWIDHKFAAERYTSENGCQCNIITNYQSTKHTKSISREIRKLGLNVHSGDKFIPSEYLQCGHYQRLELLRGLMDTDGSCCRNRPRFSTTSLQLAKDVKTLVSSLGGTAIILENDRSHHGKSNEYGVNIKMFENPFSLPRKAAQWKFSKKNPPSRYLINIERVDDAEQYCISVDHESELYLTNDFIVTHNTSILVYLSSIYGDDISFLSPTGKACQVLKSKLPHGAKVATVHHAIYQPIDVCKKEVAELEVTAKTDPLARKRLEFLKELMKNIGVEFLESIKQEYLGGIVVVDESSMLGYREYSILEKSGAKLIFVGDPFQLQPVKSKQILPDTPNKFHAFLSEVHRAALESPITRLATEIRSGHFRGWGVWKNEGIRVVEKLPIEEYRACSQILTGMNTTRQKLNRNVRVERQSYTPVVGDKIIIKQNLYQYGFEKGRKVKTLALVNGDITHTDKVMGKTCVFRTNTGQHITLLNDANFAETYSKVPVLPQKEGIRADYAYAITVHAAQGSEWKDVILYDDGMRKNNKQDRLHWMYTAVTRAKDSVTLVRPK